MDNILWTRRGVIAGAAVLPLAARAGDYPEGLIGAIEKRAGGRLGISVFDTETRQRIRYRADERFPMCSTFKLLLVAAIQNNIANGLERGSSWIRYSRADLLDYAPVTRANVGKGRMTIADLMKAAIEYSDNTAANLLLKNLGGPAKWTDYARGLGDNISRLDRNEPALNTSIPGDPRDTTTPDAMLQDMRRIMHGRHGAVQNEALIPLMLACKTADNRIRAGLPKGWSCGNKTGTGANGSTNDIAIIIPPNRKPIFMTVYFTGSKLNLPKREAVIADVARIVSKSLV
ncbi:MAG TPA: class A beta-lactamase [Rhizomicrobium sp.]|nr:class A beta-lactamase [Rhizomicrobium sp.]